MTTAEQPPQNSPWRKAIGAAAGVVLYFFFQCVRFFLWLCGPRKAARRQPGESLKVLVMGRVDSKNWCLSHLGPLSQTANVSEFVLVMDGVILPLPRTRRISVPGLIGWLRPRAIIRSAWAVVVAMREKPDIVMAYSLFPPGVFALLAARLSGAASALQMAGGALEIESGGWENETIRMPAFLVRHLVPLCRALCSHFDLVVTRGKKTEEYVRQHAHPGRIQIIPGTVNPQRFPPSPFRREIDIVFIGRIVELKQPDHICEVLQRVAGRKPNLRVVIAGRGPLLESMKATVGKLGLSRNVRFAGHVEKVEGLLLRSKVFLLTSRSEGLSIALAEAMTAGAVPVVADVGDLSQLVVNNETGWLIKPGDFDAYAARILDLLRDEKAWLRMSAQARVAALENNGVEAVARRWQTYLREVTAVPLSSTVTPSPHIVA